MNCYGISEGHKHANRKNLLTKLLKTVLWVKEKNNSNVKNQDNNLLSFS